MEPTFAFSEKEQWRWARLEELLNQEEAIFAKLKEAPTEEEKKDFSCQLIAIIKESRDILAEE